VINKQRSAEMAMTKQQFIDYWMESEDGQPPFLYQQRESLWEHECQYQSECAMFGDAGPGQGLAIREMKAELAKVEARLRSFGVVV
jgi:hypothetical protein